MASGASGFSTETDDDADTLRFQLHRGLQNFSGEVDIINRAYAFTNLHVARFFQLMAYLKVRLVWRICG